MDLTAGPQHVAAQEMGTGIGGAHNKDRGAWKSASRSSSTQTASTRRSPSQCFSDVMVYREEPTSCWGNGNRIANLTRGDRSLVVKIGQSVVGI